MPKVENLTFVAATSDFTNSTRAAGYSHDTGHRYSDACLYRDEEGNYFVADHVTCDNGDEWDGYMFALDENERLLAAADPAFVLLTGDEWYRQYGERKEDYAERFIKALETLL